jgi:hypothetical protein
MAIKSNPQVRKKPSPVVDLEAHRFIDSAPDDRQPEETPAAPVSQPASAKKVVVMKMPHDLVARIDRAATARGLKRTPWVTDRLVTVLIDEGF